MKVKAVAPVTSFLLVSAILQITLRCAAAGVEGSGKISVIAGNYKASFAADELLKALPWRYFKNMRENGVQGSLPAMSPAFLGLPAASSFANVPLPSAPSGNALSVANSTGKVAVHAALKSLLDIEDSLSINVQRGDESRQALAAGGAPAGLGLIPIPPQDVRGWEVFKAALNYLAQNGKCGSVYNKESTSYGICCIFKVDGLADDVFTYCSAPGLIGVAMPTEDDIPEVGIQYDVQRVVSSLPLPLGKKILENFQGWDTRRVVLCVKILRQEGEFREVVLETISTIEEATEQAMYDRYLGSMGTKESVGAFMQDIDDLQEAGQREMLEKVLGLLVRRREEGLGANVTLNAVQSRILSDASKKLRVALTDVTTCSIRLSKDLHAKIRDGTRSGTNLSAQSYLRQLRMAAHKCEGRLIDLLAKYRESVLRAVETLEPYQLARMAGLESAHTSVAEADLKPSDRQAGGGIYEYDFSSGGWIWNFGYAPSVKTGTTDLCRRGAKSFCYSMCCDAVQRYSPLCLSLAMSCY